MEKHGVWCLLSSILISVPSKSLLFARTLIGSNLGEDEHTSKCPHSLRLQRIDNFGSRRRTVEQRKVFRKVTARLVIVAPLPRGDVFLAARPNKENGFIINQNHRFAARNAEGNPVERYHSYVLVPKLKSDSFEDALIVWQ